MKEKGWENKNNGIPLDEGFEYWYLKREVDATTILKMRREEIIDVILTSHWEDDAKKSTYNLQKIQDAEYKYLVGRNLNGEGFFIVWDGEKSIGQLDRMYLIRRS